MIKIKIDDTTYKLISIDPLKKLIVNYKDLLKRWKTRNYIKETEFNRLFLTPANLFRAYALPKIHKPNNPYRLTVSSIGSPLHNFSKFENNHTVRNSIEFGNGIKNSHVPKDHVMLSLDVTALFTNVPNCLVIRSIKSRWEKFKNCCNIPWKEMEIALNMIQRSTFFQFNNKCYQQIEGSPMGSPLSPIFAEFVMRDLETHCLGTLINKPIKYHRYVEDIF